MIPLREASKQQSFPSVIPFLIPCMLLTWKHRKQKVLAYFFLKILDMQFFYIDSTIDNYMKKGYNRLDFIRTTTIAGIGLGLMDAATLVYG